MKKTIKAWAVWETTRNRLVQVNQNRANVQADTEQGNVAAKMLGQSQRFACLPCTITIHTKARKANGNV